MREVPTILPSDFQGNTPPPRIMGGEVEYSIFLKLNETQKASRDPLTQSVVGHIIREITTGPLATATSLDAYKGTRNAGWARNGGLFYRDCLVAIEAAGAESSGPTEATNVQFANERIVQQYTNQFCERNPQAPPVHLYARTGYALESGYKTYGFHRNALTTLVENVPTRQRDAAFIASVLTANMVILGTGMMSRRGYLLSQKAQTISLDDNEAVPLYGYDTNRVGGHKPLITWSTTGLARTNNMKSYSTKWDRLEDRSGDVSQSYWQRFMGYALLSLALRITEHEKHVPARFFKETTFKEIGKSAHRVSADNTFDNIYEMRSGESGVLNACLRMAEQAVALTTKIVLPADEVAAAHDWLATIESMKREGITYSKPETLEPFRKKMHAPARYLYIIRQTKNEDPTHYREETLELAINKDLLWDEKSPHDFGAKYARLCETERFAENEVAIQKLQHSPPETTRAASRMEVLKPYLGKKINSQKWNFVKNISGTTYMLDDPFGAVTVIEPKSYPAKGTTSEAS